METDSKTGSIFVNDGEARMVVRIAASIPVKFGQRGGFPIKPEFAANTAYILGEESFKDQWHLNATTTQPSDKVKFLAVLVPYRASEPQPEIVSLNEASSVGFRVGDTSVAAWWGDGPRGQVSAGGLTGNGRLVLKVSENGTASTVLSQ
jgi:hypothetical protein